MASQDPLIGSLWLAVDTRTDKKKIPDGGISNSIRIGGGGEI
ncbi:hypothetical protein SynWH8103_00947 [Synechococcus sp. WH 8103]|nr:hypothetical protein SynWH8103_00947 [Synechococcus sp. WH 8103]